MTRYYYRDQYGRVTHSQTRTGCGLALGVTALTLLIGFTALVLIGIYAH